MKYLSLPSFDVVTGALNIDTPDFQVTGSCDLYTTKAAGTDKKLYKNIDQSLESRNAALRQYGASLSPLQRDSMAASLNLTRSSPFGNLTEPSSRRTYAYLIATLNASHPDYDFSQVLRPADFKLERNLRRAMNSIDNTLGSVRANSRALDVAVPRNFPGSASLGSTSSVASNWGPQMWALIDEEMTLKDCVAFSYQPSDDPFDEEEGAIWALHYFFFNKALKRVCYLYVRGIPVMSHSPQLRPRSIDNSDLSSSAKRRALVLHRSGASKRARYWLGGPISSSAITNEDGYDDDDDDGLIWNRYVDGDEDWDWDEDEDEGEDEVATDDGDVLKSAQESSRFGKNSSSTYATSVSEHNAAQMEFEL